MALVPLPERDAAATIGAPKTSALARRRALREANSDIVRDLVHMTGRTHAEVNAELNRKVGVKRIGEASVRQLERRLEAAQALLKSRKL
jgi:negative regulator of replication initiation